MLMIEGTETRSTSGEDRRALDDFIAIQSQVQYAGENVANMAHVVAMYLKLSGLVLVGLKESEERIPWLLRSGKLVPGWDPSEGYTASIVRLRKEVQVAKANLEFHATELKAQAARNPGSTYPRSAELWRSAQTVMLDVGALNTLRQTQELPLVDWEALKREALEQLRSAANFVASNVGQIASETIKIVTDAQAEVGRQVLGSIPWWVWALGGVVGLGAVGYLAYPVVMPLLKARAMRSALGGVR